MRTQPPICLTIAGSDPSGGAGIQADLKTFTALGTYGAAVLAGLTVQNTQGVRDAQALDPDFVVAQTEAVLDDLPVAATKLGMLTNAETAQAVTDLIAKRREDFGIVVLDPVMVATSGDRLLSEDAVAVIRDQLTKLADVVTPNLPELAVLVDAEEATSVAELKEQARQLQAATGTAVLAKGGHLREGELLDVLVWNDGELELPGERIETRNTHGTGCTLSSATAAFAAHATGSKDVVRQAATSAHHWVARAIAAGADWTLSRNPQTGHGPVNHLLDIDAPKEN